MDILDRIDRYLNEKVKFTDEQYNYLNKLYVGGLDDDEIVDKIKSDTLELFKKGKFKGMSPEEVYKEFTKQKGA